MAGIQTLLSDQDFPPKPNPTKSRELLQLSQTNLGTMVRHGTGFGFLRYMCSTATISSISSRGGAPGSNLL
jgi:hypothetical protein